MSATLWASVADRRRIAAARAVVFLVGGYDGSGNYGDVLQLAGVAGTARGLPGGPLPVVVVERDMHAHHTYLADRHPELFEGLCFAHFQDRELEVEDGLELLGEGLAPRRAAVHLYGGGYLNRWWGERKVAHVAAAEALAERAPLPLAASGLQIEDAALDPGGPARELLVRAAWAAVRDAGSLEHLRERLPKAGERAGLAGDDAIPRLCREAGPGEPVVNLHLNDGYWVSEDPEATAEAVVSTLEGVGRAAGPLELQPILAYEDPRISERGQVEAMLGRHGARLRDASWSIAEPLDALSDAAAHRLARFRRARLTICCSYHVALSSLYAGIPTAMLAENGYYDQKAAGLRGLFGLEPGAVGISAADLDPGAALELLADGPARDRLVGRLGERSAGLAALHEEGQRRVGDALATGLAEVAAQAPSPRTIARGVRRRIARSPVIERLSR